MFIEKENRPDPVKEKEKILQLEEYIKQNIPLTGFMNFSITELSRLSIKLTAPLKPNDNHYGTVFGGSLAILGILAGWGLLHYNMICEKIEGTIVIKEGKMKFLRPALKEFEAVNNSLTETDWINFKKNLSLEGRSKIKMQSYLYSEGKLVGVHYGIYVALSTPVK